MLKDLKIIIIIIIKGVTATYRPAYFTVAVVVTGQVKFRYNTQFIKLA